MKQRCNFSFLSRFFTFAGMLALAFSAVPAANAMVASVDGTETHNLTPTSNLTEIWNRTVWTGNGTATYLGQNAGGQHLILTASHVGSSSLSIASADNNTYTLTSAGMSWRLTNTADNSNADLQIIAVTANTSSGEKFLDTLGNIEIASGITTQTNTTLFRKASTLYAVGTGRSTKIGGNPLDESGTYPRQKQWAEFTAYQKVSELVPSTTASGSILGTTACYTEFFSNTETSFQGTVQDSGSGVFVYQNGEWLLVGTLIGISGNSDTATTVGYIETENSVCVTLFADLSQYADQINAIMAIPEPSAFGLLAGTFALAVAASRSSRKKRA
ncbi:MAG: hypothetical protein IJX22_03150 [Opitutales bacterium]|nr:hypothetical protein [Opitutales bacterium]